MKEHTPHNPEKVPRTAGIGEELVDISTWVTTRRMDTDRRGSTK